MKHSSIDVAKAAIGMAITTRDEEDNIIAEFKSGNKYGK